MKIQTLGIIVFAGMLAVSGFFFLKTRALVLPHYKLTDACQEEIRAPVSKARATITNLGAGMKVVHDLLHFQFVIPDGSFRYEENVLQDDEEPIDTPTHLYTMLLTYKETRNVRYLMPVELRFVVYPTLCNTEDEWEAFLRTEGWQPSKNASIASGFHRVEKRQSGRIYARYFLHYKNWHYEFEVSQDASVPNESAMTTARSIIDSFSIIIIKEPDEAK